MSKILIKIIRSYQLHISTYSKSKCIYTPTCSQYSIQAIEKYGALKGIRLSIIRILKCRPPYSGGEDLLE